MQQSAKVETMIRIARSAAARACHVPAHRDDAAQDALVAMLERLGTTRVDSESGFAQHMRNIARGEVLKSANRSRRALHAPRDMRIECCAADTAAEIVHSEESEATSSPEQRYLRAVARTHVHLLISKSRAPEAVVAVLVQGESVETAATANNVPYHRLRDAVRASKAAIRASRVAKDLV